MRIVLTRAASCRCAAVTKAVGNSSRTLWVRRSTIVVCMIAFQLVISNSEAALFDWSGVRPAMADSGPCAPVNVSHGDLAIQGSGLRKVKIFFSVYCASLYLASTTSDAKSILDDREGRKLIAMRYMRDVTADDAREYLKEALKNACEADEKNCPAQEIQIEYLDAIAVDIADGDVTTIEFGKDELGQYGLLIRLPTDSNGEGKRIRSAGLARIVLGIFIGPAPIDADLKKCLLGIRC